jgi:hypothetical protein
MANTTAAAMTVAITMADTITTAIIETISTTGEASRAYDPAEVPNCVSGADEC